MREMCDINKYKLKSLNNRKNYEYSHDELKEKTYFQCEPEIIDNTPKDISSFIAIPLGYITQSPYDSQFNLLKGFFFLRGCLGCIVLPFLCESLLIFSSPCNFFISIFLSLSFFYSCSSWWLLFLELS